MEEQTGEVLGKGVTLLMLNSKMILLVGLTGSFSVAFFPMWKELVAVWVTSEDYSHGFLIVPMAAYISWLKRSRLASTQVRGSRWGLSLVILSLIAYLIAHYANIRTVASFSILPLIAGVVLFLLGPSHLLELLFPITLLLFMIPIPEQIYSQVTLPLQLFVTKLSVWFTASLGIPIYAEGNVIHLPDRTMQVVQACSGLRSMISIMPLAAVLGYFTLKSNPLRWILFLSGVPASIAVNIVRVILLVGAYYYFGFDLTAGIAHTIFGIFIFMLALIFLCAIMGILGKWDVQHIQK